MQLFFSRLTQGRVLYSDSALLFCFWKTSNLLYLLCFLFVFKSPGDGHSFLRCSLSSGSSAFLWLVPLDPHFQSFPLNTWSPVIWSFLSHTCSWYFPHSELDLILLREMFLCSDMGIILLHTHDFQAVSSESPIQPGLQSRFCLFQIFS